MSLFLFGVIAVFREEDELNDIDDKPYSNCLTGDEAGAVFNTEEIANKYIKARTSSKDRDDEECTLVVEPWCVQETL